MSYFTHVRISHWGDDSVTREALLSVARQHIEQCGYHEDVLTDFTRGLDEGQTEVSDLRSGALADLFRDLSRQFPAVTFCVWGAGEEPRDVWVREFLGGKLTFKRGPFV